jgi:hypothetical protein
LRLHHLDSETTDIKTAQEGFAVITILFSGSLYLVKLSVLAGQQNLLPTTVPAQVVDLKTSLEETKGSNIVQLSTVHAQKE